MNRSENKLAEPRQAGAGSPEQRDLPGGLRPFPPTRAGELQVAGFSSSEMEKEVINILADSALFTDLEAEDRQRLVKHLLSLMYH
jgi:hypothetical protein